MKLPSLTTHYSLLEGFIKPEEAAQKCRELGYSHCLLSDNNLSGAVDFYKSMTEEGIVPIIGLSTSQGKYIAKNLQGYKDLIKISSNVRVETKTSDIEFYPHLDLDTLDVRYADTQDAILHRTLLCTKNKTTMSSPSQGHDDKYFRYSDYCFTKAESYDSNIKKLISELEPYTILSKPKLPKVNCGDMTEAEYLTKLCNDQFPKVSALDEPKYRARLQEELNIITSFGLSGYFLVVRGIIDFVRNSGWLPGPGRGSAAGSLVSFILKITEVDPIKYNLLFSRFLNTGRFSAGNISLPDIDMDVPSVCRDAVIEYIKKTYGTDKVGQMITLGRLQGRSAIKEIARVHMDLSFAELNEITESLPAEASISDELEEMDVKSVIMWTLENRPNKLKRWCEKDSSGKLVGEYSDLFSLAIRIEGTYKSRGVHPAGVVISNEPLVNDAPVTINKSGDPVVGFEMSSLDPIGLAKFDVLGLNLLDKLAEICSAD